MRVIFEFDKGDLVQVRHSLYVPHNQLAEIGGMRKITVKEYLVIFDEGGSQREVWVEENMVFKYEENRKAPQARG